MKKLKSILGRVKKELYIHTLLRRVIKQINDNRDKDLVFLFQTPTHSNIGDHAIAMAQLEFINQQLPNSKIIEINQLLINKFLKENKSIITKSDIIILLGGGNFGNEYMFEEKLRRLVISKLPDNKIIIFPQTIHYSKDKEGKRELEITQNIFNQRPKVVIAARERISFDLAKKYFPSNNVILTPDIVLSMSKKFDFKRKYALAVIRNDQESILSKEMKSIIIDILSSNFENVVQADMHVANYKSVLTPDNRTKVVTNKLEQFAKAKIVITDRLHGMVLAAITGTPCIAFSNYNQKVRGTYEWISHLKYIKYVEDEPQLLAAFNELSNYIDKKNQYSPSDIAISFNPLKLLLQNE